MSDRADQQRLERTADALQRIPDPLLRLQAAREARARMEAVEAAALQDARRSGVTWKAIGAVYGLSKQGAQQRFRDTPPSAG